MDDTIVRMMEHVVKVTVQKDFYAKYPSLAHIAFSKPYPMMARHMLGYPAPDIEFAGISPGDGSSNNYDMSAATVD
jgi:hypothetical protein